MSIKPYLKQIARGSKGASDLSREDAADLLSRILSGEVSDLELGAFYIAMRIKGETADELAGFYDALKPHLISLSFTRPVVLLPSYNGARKTHLMTPLLARLLADSGYLVLVHGVHEELARTSSEEVFAEMGWAVIRDPESLQQQLEEHAIAYCPVSVLCKPLANMLSARHVLGLRNTGHILTKMINPVRSLSFQVCNYTHPAYPTILEQFFTTHKANAVYMRGHEGEPVASPRRLPELGICIGAAVIHTDPCTIDEPLPFTQDISAPATANLYRSLLSGQDEIPKTLLMQVQALHQAFSRALQPVATGPEA